MSAHSIETRQLRAFVALVDSGSVTAAARALGLAQSTVSEALAALERTLGAAVVVRRRGGQEPVLTAAGAALLPHARAALEALDAAQAAVAGAAATARASVAIITNESVSTYLLPGLLNALRERWPNARFAVSVGPCHDVRAGVARGEFDAGVLLSSASQHRHGDDEHIVLAPDVPLVVFAMRAHPLASDFARGALRRDQIAGYPLFVSDAAGDFHALLARFFEHDGVPGPALHPAGSVEGVKRGVRSDPRALGVLPAYAVAEELGAGPFVPIRLRPAPPRMRLEAVLPAAASRHSAVAALLDGLRTSIPAAIR